MNWYRAFQSGRSVNTYRSLSIKWFNGYIFSKTVLLTYNALTMMNNRFYIKCLLQMSFAFCTAIKASYNKDWIILNSNLINIY